MKRDKKSKIAPAVGQPIMQVAGGTPSAPNMTKPSKSKKHGNKAGRILAVVSMCILLAGLSVTAIILIITGGAGREIVINKETVIIDQQSKMPEYASGSIIINNSDSTGKVAYKSIGDILYLDLNQFFEFAGANVRIGEDGTIEVACSKEIAKFTVDSTSVEVTTKENNTTRTATIETAPSKENDKIYFNVKDLLYIFSDVSINTDEQTQVMYINLGAQYIESVEGSAEDQSSPAGEAPAIAE